MLWTMMKWNVLQSDDARSMFLCFVYSYNGYLNFTKMSAQKSIPLTKEEVMQLVNLVEANPVLFTKATNASNNHLKEATWLKITNRFNSLIASNPRKPEQLRLKWENLKKTARKRSTKIRMNNLKTGGGKPEYIPPDDALDKVAAILGPTCEGYSILLGGDAEVEATEDIVEELVVDPLRITVPFVDNICTSPSNDPTSLSLLRMDTECTPVSTMRTPQNKKFFFSSSNSKGKIKRQKVSDDVKESVIARNLAIAGYFEAKKIQEEVIAALKKKKLELEITELEKKICPNPWDDSTK